MAHGDQVRCALGTHNSRDLRHRQHVTFFHAAALDEPEGLRADQDPRRRRGRTVGDLLLPHIDHFGPSLSVKMCKILAVFHNKLRNAVVIPRRKHRDCRLHVLVGYNGGVMLRGLGQPLAAGLPADADLPQRLIFIALHQYHIHRRQGL